MTDFMTHQQIIDNVGCFLPVGQGQHTVIYVEGCSGHRFVLYHKVLCCQQTGKVTFDLLGQHGVSQLMHIL